MSPHIGVFRFFSVTLALAAACFGAQPGAREHTVENDSARRTWRVACATDGVDAFFLGCTTVGKGAPKFDQWGSSIRVNEVNAMIATMSKFSEWAETVKEDKPAPFTKMLPDVGSRRWQFRWDGKAATFRPIDDDESRPLTEDDSRMFRILLYSAPDMMAEVAAAQIAAQDYHRKLK